MELDNNVNFIVSGLERSGTSMLMQILKAGKLPIFFDQSRVPDVNNPKGYYELEGGKIINKLIDETFNLDDFKGKFIKITAYGLKFLPSGSYKIIYSERDIEEILDSMEKMTNITDETRDDTREVFLKLNRLIKHKMVDRDDIDFLLVNYNQILLNPEDSIKRIVDFLEIPIYNIDDMVKVVDDNLYRQRRKKNI